MGNFNVKNFFGSMFTPVQDEEYEENYYEEETGYADEPEEAYIEEPIVEEQPFMAEPRAYVQEQPAVTTPVVSYPNGKSPDDNKYLEYSGNE